MSQNNPVQTAEERDLAQLIVDCLNLDNVGAADIVPEEPLFGNTGSGLGLDSIDALEIALAIQQRHGVELRSDADDVKSIFSSLRALSAYVSRQRSSA